MSPFQVRRRLAFAAGSGLLLALLIGGPAVADSELGHTGTTGVHSLRDASSTPGATCKYRFATDSYVLKRITVAPPRVRAISGSQQVGWKFTVQRRFAFEGTTTSWYETYSSTVQTATTDSAHDATFTSKTVSVLGAGATDGMFSYRVLIRMLWYRAGGGTQGTAVHKVDWYRLVDNPFEDLHKFICYGHY